MRVNQKSHNIKYQHWSTDDIIQNNKKVYEDVHKSVQERLFFLPNSISIS